MKRVLITAIAVALCQGSVIAHAKNKADRGPWRGEIEAGYVSTSGNTEERNVKSRAKMDYETSQWRDEFFYDSLNNSSENERTAEKYFLSNKLAHPYSRHNYSFVFASYDDDRFSGFDYQATAAIGYGRRLLNNDQMAWDAEIGPGYRYSKSDDPAERTQEEAVLRAYTTFTWEFSPTATFEQELGTEAGEENTISKSLSSLRVSIIGSLALKLSYAIKHTADVPPGKDETDTETAVTLSYSF